MEVTELTNLTFTAIDGPPPFCLSANSDGTAFTINNRTHCEVVHLKYDHGDDDNLKLQLSVCSSTSDRPTARLLSDPGRELRTEPHQLRPQDLLLDALMLPQLVPDPPDSVFTAIELSTCDAIASPLQHRLLAALTNFGALHVFAKSAHERRWSRRWADVSAHWHIWHDGTHKKPVQSSVDAYTARVRQQHIVAFAWEHISRHGNDDAGAPPTEERLVAVTASGSAVFFAITKLKAAVNTLHITEPNVRFIFSETLAHQVSQVSHVRWLSVAARLRRRKTNGKPVQSYLCTADIMGNIRVYTVTTCAASNAVTGVQYCIDCLATNIPMRIGALHLQLCGSTTATSSPVVIACIGSKVLVFFVTTPERSTPQVGDDDAAAASVQICVHSVPGHALTGCSRLAADKYAVCSADGLVQMLTLDAAGKRIANVQNVRTGLNMDKYHMLGVTTTRHLAMWLFVLYPRHSFDHLVLRQPLVLSVCAADMDVVLQRLVRPLTREAHRRDVGRISELHDCAEVFRYRQMRHPGVMLSEEQLSMAVVQTTTTVDDEGVVFALRAQLLLLHGIAGHFRRNGRQVLTDALRAEMGFIRNTLVAIVQYKHLQRMRTEALDVDASDHQRLACRCMQQTLRQYAAIWSAAVPERYATFGARLCDAFVGWCHASDGVNAAAELREECSQCEAAVEPVGGTACTAGHPVERCCVSAMLLPVVSTSGCVVCHAGALESGRELEHVMRLDAQEWWQCPVCDVPLSLKE